jgi:hypothetical protein
MITWTVGNIYLSAAIVSSLVLIALYYYFKKMT